MGALDFSQFGGLMPSVNKRDLPADGAQTALNLDQRYPDFRPTAVASAVATITTGTKSIFYTAKTGTLLTSTNAVNYVSDLVQDMEATETVYLTDPGAAYPQAWRSGSFRRLGVVPPANKMDQSTPLVLTEGFEFTADDASLFELQTLDKWKGALGNNMAEDYKGYTSGLAPFTGGAFWIPHGYAGVSGLTTIDLRQGVYATPCSANGIPTNADHKFMADPALGAVIITASGAVGLSNGTYLAVPMFASARTWDFDRIAFETTVAANIRHPNPVPDAPLIPASTVTAMATNYETMLSPTVAPRNSMIDDLETLVAEGGRFLNSTSDSFAIAEMTAFYAAANGPTAAMNAAADLLAETLYTAAAAIWNADELVETYLPVNQIPAADHWRAKMGEE